MISPTLVRRLACFLLITSAHARLPEPDAVVYGFITLNGSLVTAARTDVVVEARRIAQGPVLASYRMGSDPGAGHRYVLRIPLESLTPPVPPLAAAIGETVHLEVRSPLEILGGQVQTLAERGQVRRLDFSLGNASDNGLPDAWEIAFFGSAGQDPAEDPDLDGLTNRHEYEAGTHPLLADDTLALAADTTSGSPRVSFIARAPQGAGYPAGATRLFTLESSETPGTGWTPIPGFTDVPGAGQVVVMPVSTTVRAAFFRLRVVLR